MDRHEAPQAGENFLRRCIVAGALFGGILAASNSWQPVTVQAGSQEPDDAAIQALVDAERPGFLEALFNRRRQVIRQIGEHLRLTTLAMGLAIAVGVSAGVLLTRLEKLATFVLGVASVIQTVPSLALLALMIPLLGIGLLPAVMALFLYALLPIMRNTYTAIREVGETVIEVGQAMGMTNLQILWRVEIPLCISVVMAGIRTSTVICVGIATLCTFIGAGGLGTSIMQGMQNRGSTLILVGVVPAIALALLLDALMATVQRLLTPKGLRLEK